MNFMDNESGAMQIRDEPLVPAHITPDIIEAAARDYWTAISERHWTNLEFETRRAVIREVMRQTAMTWALKISGIG